MNRVEFIRVFCAHVAKKITESGQNDFSQSLNLQSVVLAEALACHALESDEYRKFLFELNMENVNRLRKVDSGFEMVWRATETAQVALQVLKKYEAEHGEQQPR